METVFRASRMWPMCTYSEPSGRAAHMMSPVIQPSAPWSPTWNKHTHTKTMQQAQAEFWYVVILNWCVSLPCGLLVGPQEDFHIFMDVLHLFESFKEFLRNESTHNIFHFPEKSGLKFYRKTSTEEGRKERMQFNVDYLRNRCISSPAQCCHFLRRQLKLGQESLNNLSSHFQTMTEGNKHSHLNPHKHIHV